MVDLVITGSAGFLGKNLGGVKYFSHIYDSLK